MVRTDFSFDTLLHGDGDQYGDNPVTMTVRSVRSFGQLCLNSFRWVTLLRWLLYMGVPVPGQLPDIRSFPNDRGAG